MAKTRSLVSLSAALLTAIAAAAPSGLLVPNAAAQVARRPEDDDDNAAAPLLLAASDSAAMNRCGHRSHSSHSSHRSHSSHYSGSRVGGGSYDYDPSPSPALQAPEPPPPPPPPRKPARVSFVAFPGGRVTVDGAVAGHDATAPLSLKPGKHFVRVENRFLGEHTTSVEVTEGQTGTLTIKW